MGFDGFGLGEIHGLLIAQDEERPPVAMAALQLTQVGWRNPHALGNHPQRKVGFLPQAQQALAAVFPVRHGSSAIAVRAFHTKWPVAEFGVMSCRRVATTEDHQNILAIYLALYRLSA
jgi:hypothetical protein